MSTCSWWPRQEDRRGANQGQDLGPLCLKKTTLQLWEGGHEVGQMGCQGQALGPLEAWALWAGVPRPHLWSFAPLQRWRSRGRMPPAWEASGRRDGPLTQPSETAARSHGVLGPHRMSQLIAANRVQPRPPAALTSSWPPSPSRPFPPAVPTHPRSPRTLLACHCLLVWSTHCGRPPGRECPPKPSPSHLL